MHCGNTTFASSQGPAYSGFRDWIGSGPFHVDTEPKCSGQFSWSIRESRMDDVQITYLAADPLVICRSQKQIHESLSTRLFVTLQITGHSSANQFGRATELKPGDFVILDGDIPYTIEYSEPAERLILGLPKDLIGGRLPSIASFALTRFQRSPGIQTLFTGFLSSLASESHAISNRSISTVINRLTDLLLLVVEENLYGDLDSNVTTNRATHIRSIERYIDLHLADSDLCPAKIAAKHGISERYVQSLFATKKVSVTKFIRDKRLDRCREALIDIRFGGRTVSEICLGWGFNDPAYFTRAFKQRYSIPPGAYRNHARETAS